ncbi:MAG: BlaI/MecI/CopY family transcriptional regulator, partial [Psychroserpens sp.]|nr:BlaI/MecI/CopY family transcriptional regulator [Psychroserpens sp.]
LSTIIRNLEDKGYVSYNAFGKTHQYFPIVSKEAYKKKFMTTAIENYFNSSYKNVVSFFAKEEKISVDELKEIIALIEKKN